MRKAKCISPICFAFLLPRRVEQRLDLFALAHVFGVGHDADDLDFTLAIDNRDTLAEHVFVGEELAREGLIDDGDFGRMLIVLRREVASAQQGDFHRRKIVLAQPFAAWCRVARRLFPSRRAARSH